MSRRSMATTPREGVIVVLVTVALALTGYTGGADPARAGKTSPTPTGTASPRDSASSEMTQAQPGAVSQTETPSAAVIPTSCADLISRAGHPDFARLPLNDPQGLESSQTGAITPRPVPTTASLSDAVVDSIRLRCLWGPAYTLDSSLVATVGRPGRATAAAYIASFEGSDYTCVELDGGRRCTGSSVHEVGPPPVVDTLFTRDDIVVEVQERDVAAADVMGSIIERIWG